MTSVLDIIFPKYNRDFFSISEYLSTEEITSLHSKFKPLSTKYRKYISGIFVASRYSNELILDLLNRVKFDGEYAISESFAELIYQKIFVDCDVFVPDPDVIIPVASDPERLLERGFSLPHLIAKHLSKKLPKTQLEDILKKKYSTPQQSTLEKKERLKNLTNLFEIIEKPSFTDKDILWLIDDVTSTGTTLYQNAKVLKKAYPFLQIYCIVVAGN